MLIPNKYIDLSRIFVFVGNKKIYKITPCASGLGNSRHSNNDRYTDDTV